MYVPPRFKACSPTDNGIKKMGMAILNTTEEEDSRRSPSSLHSKVRLDCHFSHSCLLQHGITDHEERTNPPRQTTTQEPLDTY